MDDNNWEYGDDDEELFELAMHDRQYRDYKSGTAKKRFEDELQRAKDAAMVKNGYSEEEIKKLKRAKACLLYTSSGCPEGTPLYTRHTLG